MLEKSCFTLLTLLISISTVLAYSFSVPFHQPIETRTTSISDISTLNSKNLFIRSSLQCSCPNCGCNGQAQCPKPVPANSYVVLSSMEDCATTNQIPGIGMINIQSTSDGNGFRYYIVDEPNKNKALSGQPFEYSAYKSQNDPSTCTFDPSAKFRFPNFPGKAFVIARSSNVVFNTDVRFNIQMSCVPTPATQVEINAKPTTYPRFYIGSEITFSFSFRNRFNEIDSWQNGGIKCGNTLGAIKSGEGKLFYTPLATGSLDLSFYYTPDASVFGGQTSVQTHTISVYKMATHGTLETVPRVNNTRPFNIRYTFFDNDNTVTPMINNLKLKISATNENVKFYCDLPSTSSGSGTVSCTLTSSVKGETTYLTMTYNGQVYSTSSVISIGNVYEPYTPPANHFNAIMIGICFCVVAVIICVIVAVIIIVCIYRKRRTATLQEDTVKFIN